MMRLEGIKLGVTENCFEKVGKLKDTKGHPFMCQSLVTLIVLICPYSLCVVISKSA